MANLGIYRGRDQETFLAIDVSGEGDLLLRADQAINKTLKFTGELSGARNILFPGGAEAAGVSWVCHNATTGAFTLTAKAPGGTGVTLAQGAAVPVRSDGTDILTALPALAVATSLDVDAVGNAAAVVQIDHAYSNSDFGASSGNHPDYSALVLNHINLADTANVANFFDLIWTGLRSNVVWGSDTVNARGTGHGVTVTVDVQGSASGNNEMAAFMGWMRAKAASGTPADGVASHWFCDYSLHGNIGAQSALLNGITMLVNSHDPATPVRGRSSAAWFVTKPGQGGGAEDGHSTAETYPLDCLAAIFGYAGDVAQTTPRRGAVLGLNIGEWGSGWSVVADDGTNWQQHGISVRGGEESALRVRDPHYDASDNPVGSAILYDTVNPALSWNWLIDQGGGNAPLVGAIRLHEANSVTAGRVQWGNTGHAPAMYRPADGSLTFRLPDLSAGAKVHVHRTFLSDPAFEVGGTDATAASLSAMVRNDSGQISLVCVGALNNFWTGAAAGDVGIRWDADQILGFVGDSALLGSISGAGAWSIAPAAGSVGFFGGAGTTKATVTGSRGANAALASLLTALAAYGLIVDSSS